MKKLIILFAVGIIVLITGYYFFSSQDNENLVLSQDQALPSQNAIFWKAERISGGSNVPTYNLTLNIGNQMFDIHDYQSEELFGCYDYGSGEITRPAGTEAPSESVSDQLCYFMAGGDLFYVVENENGYQVFHKKIMDGLPEDAPVLLFTSY